MSCRATSNLAWLESRLILDPSRASNSPPLAVLSRFVFIQEKKKKKSDKFAIHCLQIEDCYTLPDERSIINTVGTRRFEIIDKWNKDDYLVGKVRWLNDELPTTDEEIRYAGSLVHKLVHHVNHAKDHPRVLGALLKSVFLLEQKKKKKNKKFDH